MEIVVLGIDLGKNSCSVAGNRVSITERRSRQRQRTTPSFARSGPARTSAFNSTIYSADSTAGRPLRGASRNAAGPSAL